MQIRIPFSPPDITEKEIKAVIEVLKSGWITTGPQTKAFEQKISEYCGTEKTACLNSATAALELTLRLLGIGAEDEVITCAYTYTASASVISHVGAKVVLVDTAKDSFHISYEALADAITEKTKAVIAVDIAGVMCDYDEIFKIVKSKSKLFRPVGKWQKALGRIAVIADAAHSFGASYKGRKSGQAADFTCFSFHAVKNLTTGEGGAVTWRPHPRMNGEELYRQYMLYSLHGQSKDALAKTKTGKWEYDIMLPAYKCNMTDINAAIGIAQLERYDGLLKKRRRIIERYDMELQDAEIRPLRHFSSQAISNGHLYLTRLSRKTESERNEFIRRMSEMGIAVNVHYKPLPMHTAYKNMGFDIRNFPHAYEAYRNEVTLPVNTLLGEEEICDVISAVKRLLEE